METISMEQTAPAPENNFLFPQNPIPESPNILPGYYKCLSCEDYGNTCNGPSLRTLGDIASVRSFHKAVKKARKIPLRAIADAAPQISDSTINEYFSNSVKDYKWTTVSHIDSALVSICGNRVGMPPLDHACPASSSEVRQQLAAADLKLAAAELKSAQHENEVSELRKKLTETKGKHIAQIAQLENNHAKDVEWLKDDIRLWRRFAFLLLGIGVILLAALVFYIGWDVAHPATGIIRY